MILGIFVICHAGVSLVAAQGIPDLKIEAHPFSCDNANQRCFLKNATLSWAEITLEAGEVELDLQKRTLIATNFVRYADSQILAILDRLEIDLDSQQGIFYNVAIGLKLCFRLELFS